MTSLKLIDHRVPKLVVDASASACVSTYSRIFATLPFRTVMAKTQLSSNVLFVAFADLFTGTWKNADCYPPMKALPSNARP